MIGERPFSITLRAQPFVPHDKARTPSKPSPSEEKAPEPRQQALYEVLLNTEKAANFTVMEHHLTELLEGKQDPGISKFGHGIAEKARTKDELRRPVFLKDSLHFHYLPYMCFQSRNCEFGRRCALSHNQAQIAFHPLKFKTSLCQVHTGKQELATCPFSHSPEGLREVRELIQFGVSPPLPQSLSSSSNLSELDKREPQASNLIHSSPNGINNPGILNPGYEENLITHLDLRAFKLMACPAPDTHNPKRCVYYHDANKDRRRTPQTYTAELCEFIGAGQECPDGDHCAYAHNRVQQFYHPDKYKTKFCTTYPNGYPVSPSVQCEYGNFCAFAHNTVDIRIDLLHHYRMDMDFYLFHYKTVWCPFNESEHDRSSCVYAHNWQDFRRKWHFYFYEAEQCSQWNSKNYITNYNQGCPDGRQCKRSHGWKELEFHPYYYKTSACKYGLSCQKPHCPFFHRREEKRDLNFDGFQIVPKTRATCFQTAAYVGDLFNGFEQRSLHSDHNRYLVNTSSLGVIQDLRNSRDELSGLPVRSGSGLGWQLYGHNPRNHHHGGRPAYPPPAYPNPYLGRPQIAYPPPHPMYPAVHSSPVMHAPPPHAYYQPQGQSYPPPRMYQQQPQPRNTSEWGQPQPYMKNPPSLVQSSSYNSQSGAGSKLLGHHSMSLNEISLRRGDSSPGEKQKRVEPPPGFAGEKRSAGSMEDLRNQKSGGEPRSVSPGQRKLDVIREMPTAPMFGKIRIPSMTDQRSPGGGGEQPCDFEDSSQDSENEEEVGKKYKPLYDWLVKHKLRDSLWNSFEMQNITLERLLTLEEAKINSFSFFESEAERERLKAALRA